MGAAAAQQTSGDGLDAGSEQGSRPHFFLASCPDDVLEEVVALVESYGGFSCVSEEDAEDFQAWKGKIAGQFLTLKRLSLPAQKVIGIAIAGFGHCNNEREFLMQMRKKKNHEQFELKQCGDASDMARWLQSQGYKQVRISAMDSYRSMPQTMVGESMQSRLMETGGTHTLGSPERAQPGLWESMNSMFGGDGRGAGARRERSLMDLQKALADSRTVSASNATALKEAQTKLNIALQNAQSAGASRGELQAAQSRDSELQQLILDTQPANGPCWCCCRETRESRREEIVEHGIVVVGKARGDTTLVEYEFDDRTKALESEIAQRQHNLQQKQESLQMRTMLPAGVNAQQVLKPGTRCRYSSSRNGWLSAMVQGYNPSDETYDLDVRPHAKLENIAPAGDIPASKAWPAGTIVEYQSTTAGQWMPAVIRSFNEGETRGTFGTYNLDIRDHAAVDRIRLRGD